MATLESIGLSLVGGSFVLGFSLVFFGVAVSKRHPFIAPRATARPADVIYNPSAEIGDPQHRGSPMLGWIPWTLGLPYHVMLKGIPGTGTRENGKSGSLLTVKLDGIVLLRFHALAMRVAGFASVLYLLILLPTYLSAQCYRDDLYDDDNHCDTNQYNLTNYQRLTLANVPAVGESDKGADEIKDTFANGTTVNARLYAVVFLFCVVATYACDQLHKEWVHVLALRRVYYLESDVWGERREELKRTLMYEEIAEKKKKKRKQFTFQKMSKREDDCIDKKGSRQPKIEKQDDNSHLIHRLPWIPHPEQRDTVTNVALYSVLVGGLPSLPKQAADAIDTDATISFSKRQSIDWQLSLTSTFFDHCVPNQPGFSSSVAAVTIIPGAKSLAVAWKKWLKAAAKLRRLQFIREQIQLRRYYSIEEANSGISGDADEVYVPEDKADNYNFDDEHRATPKQRNNSGGGLTLDENIPKLYKRLDSNKNHYQSGSGGTSLFDLEIGTGIVEASTMSLEDTPRDVYETPHKNAEYYRQVLGTMLSDDADQSYTSFTFGPEQASVYSREFAHAASGCCPHGCFEDRIRNASIDELIAMEREAAAEVHQANLELKKARNNAAVVAEFNEDMTGDDAAGGGSSGGNMEAIQEETGIEASNRAPSSHEFTSTSAHSDGFRQDSFDDLPDDPAKLSPAPSSEMSRKNSRHSRRLSLEGFKMPSDLGLEAQLYRKLSLDPPKEPHRNQLPTTSASPAKSSKTLQKPAMVKRANTTTATSTPRTPSRKMHRRRLSLGSKKLPSDLQLEVELFRRSSMDEDDLQPIMKSRSSDHTRKKTLSWDHCIKDSSVPSFSSNSSIARHNNENNAESIPANLENERFEHTDSVSKVYGPLHATLKGVETAQRPVVDVEEQRRPSLMDSNCTGSSHSELDPPSFSGELALNDPGGGDEGRLPCIREKSSKTISYASTGDSPNASSDKKEHSNSGKSAQWSQVESIVGEALTSMRTKSSRMLAVSTGVWRFPSIKTLFRRTKRNANKVQKWAKEQTNKAVDNLARDSTYAVITFTSRQAAVAARACLADGRGQQRWMALKEIPIPPLADAPAWNLSACRNCCRPVTLSINDRQKNCRNYIAIMLLSVIYVFYTFPLTAAAKLVEPGELSELFPQTKVWAAEQNFEVIQLLSGLLTAGIWSSFFALCPIMFMAIANFGSKATSVAHAEYKAMQYYWWFMVLTAFSGQLLMDMTINGLNEGLSIGSEFQSVVREIAKTIPSVTSFTWLNWIIFRFMIVLPLNYLLQTNSFMFHWFGLNCCSRVVRGGGPGGPIPYRIYIDSGVVLMCLFALAPSSPLVAPACFTYYLFCQPLWRRNLIFTHRPKFDGGGHRWPFIFDMCISAMILGEILLTVQMGLKQATGPAFAAGASMVPTLLFSKEMKTRFLRAFDDASLLQTSLLDGWDNTNPYSFEKREEFRKFLVDAHKAAYVPVCLASPDTEDFLTAEPAVVVAQEGEEAHFDPEADVEPLNDFASSHNVLVEGDVESIADHPEKRTRQHGATLRRASIGIAALRRSSISVQNLDACNFEDLFAGSMIRSESLRRSSGSRHLNFKAE